MDLDQLRASISEMSEDELHELIRTTREERRKPASPRKASAKKKASAKAKKTESLSIDALIAALSPEEIKALLAECKGKDS